MGIDNKAYTLILNKSFQPLGIEGVKKSLGYLIGDEGRALDPVSYELYTFNEWVDKKNSDNPDITIKSEKLWFYIPEIIVLNTTSMKIKKRSSNSFSKRKVFERDGNTCGYCGCELSGKNKTIDHVIPLSRKGPNNYKNVTACCFSCNSKKGDRTPEEMGWILKHDLYPPESNILYRIPKHKRLDSWKQFIK
jgi:hypothetical protein